MKNPRVYMVGKISKNGWRNELLPEVRNTPCDDRTWKAIHGNGFVYCGPFFLSCDHGCYHGEGTHGLGSCDKQSGCADKGLEASEVVTLCRKWLTSADLVFGWMDDLTAFGSLVEIGWAQSYGIPLFLAFPNKALARKMWFAHSYPGTKIGTYRCVSSAFQDALSWYRVFI